MEKVIAYLRDPATKASIVSLIREHLPLYQGLNTRDKIESFTGAAYNQFVRECLGANQYVAIPQSTAKDINRLYRDLIGQLRLHGAAGSGADGYDGIEAIVEKHRHRLIAALESIDQTEHRQLIVPCAEYSQDFQIGVLRLDIEVMMEPILDVGCGSEHRLVDALRGQCGNVFGIDQFLSSDPSILSANWLDFTFRPSTWGTVISHMAFSNHFRRSIALRTSDRKRYETKYAEILDSLLPGGRFIYTPSLREIENDLDPDRFAVSYFSNTADPELDTVQVRRLDDFFPRGGFLAAPPIPDIKC